MESGETDMNAIIDIAAKLTNKQRIRDIKKRMTTQLKSEKHSLSALMSSSPQEKWHNLPLTWIKIKPFGAPLWKNQHILMGCIGDVKAGKL